MTKLLRSSSLLACALALTALRPAVAGDFCLPVATGVPTRQGPPVWWLSTDPNGQHYDDPRWLGAAGYSFDYGTATTPFQVRALSSNVSGTNFLYLSFTVNVDPTAASHELYLGIHRPGAHPVGNEAGYILQFHVNVATASDGTGPITPTFCANQSCAGDWYGIFHDQGNDTGGNPNCSGTSVTQQKFKQFTPGTAPAWLGTTARYFKVPVDATKPLQAQNQWVVEVQIPQVTAVSTDGVISTGIETGSTLWYEAAQLAPGNADNLLEIGQWPQAKSANSVCKESTASPPTLFHTDLTTANAATGYELTSADSAGTPSDCDGGLYIQHSDIGSLHNATPADITNLPTTGLDNDTTIYASGVNTLVAQVENTTTSQIKTAIQGRFRLASWGTAPWAPNADPGHWIDIRGEGSGVCSSGTAPACNVDTFPPTVAGGPKTSIHFDWQLGTDATIGKSEFCEYGLTAPGETCQTCSCTATGAMCGSGDDAGPGSGSGGSGTQSVDASNKSDGPCVPSFYPHECMLVELSVPTGFSGSGSPASGGGSGSGSGNDNPVTFVSTSSWNNMNFAQMSEAKRTALVDVRGLPTVPGQTYQDIYLLVMPRNMPATLPAGTTGISLVQNNALAIATNVASSYGGGSYGGAGYGSGGSANVGASILIRPVGGGELGSRIQQIEAIRKLMPPGDGAKVDALLALAQVSSTAEAATHQAVKTLGAPAAAQVVPTLEIYPYYQTGPNAHTWAPMTAFTVFLSHEGALGGITYQIDGATKVAQDIYHLRVPIDHIREIQVRSEAITAGVIEAAGNPNWPCGCCGGAKCGIVGSLGNTAPGLLMGIVVIGRRKKRKPSKAS